MPLAQGQGGGCQTLAKGQGGGCQTLAQGQGGGLPNPSPEAGGGCQTLAQGQGGGCQTLAQGLGGGCQTLAQGQGGGGADKPLIPSQQAGRQAGCSRQTGSPSQLCFELLQHAAVLSLGGIHILPHVPHQHITLLHTGTGSQHVTPHSMPNHTHSISSHTGPPPHTHCMMASSRLSIVVIVSSSTHHQFIMDFLPSHHVHSIKQGMSLPPSL